MGIGDAWFGTNNNADRENDTYIDRILNSKVALNLKTNQHSLNDERINEIRNLLKISCNDKEEVTCDLSKNQCLFKIDEDPCERKNLAEDPQYADVLKDMLTKLNTAMSKVVPPRNAPRGNINHLNQILYLILFFY